MDLGKLTSSATSGFRVLETTVEKQVEIVKTEGEICMQLAGKAAVEGGNLIEGGIKDVGEGIEAVKDTAVKCVNIADEGVENILKFKRICENIYGLAFKFKSYLEDDSLIESSLALAVWIALCYFFEIWMIPVIVLIIYVKNLIMHCIFGVPEQNENEGTVDKSIKQKMEAIEEVIGLVRALISKFELILQKIFGFVSLKSLHLTWLAILIQVVVTLVLMYIPINFLLMLWGISLYMRKFLKKKDISGKVGQKGGEEVVEATEELQGVTGDFLSFNFSRGISQMKDAFGKLSAKCD